MLFQSVKLMTSHNFICRGQEIYTLLGVVKGYHIYKFKPPIGALCDLAYERDQKYKDAISVKYKQNMVGHVAASPHPLSEALRQLKSRSSNIHITWYV